MHVTERPRRIAKPPDGGWGWVVVFASFMIHVIADGVAYTFGLFFIELTDDLHASRSATSWIASIMAGVTYASGPIAGAFVNKYGCRPVSIFGSFLAATGFGISYYANSVTFLYLSIGIVGGIGLGMIYLPAIVSVTCYFEQRRAFATGIAVCGSGFGTFVLAPLTELLIREYEWRGALLITSVIILHCAIFSALFRPLPEPAEPDEEAESETLPTIAEPSGTDSADSVQPLIASTEVLATKPIAIKQSVDIQITNNDGSGLSESVPHTGIKTHASKFVSKNVGDTLTMSCSHPVLPVGIGSIDSLHKFQGSGSRGKRYSLKFGLGPDDVVFEGSSPRHRAAAAGSTMSSTSVGLITNRKDIFYSGSVANIATASVDTRKSLTERMTRTPDDSKENLTSKRVCGCIPCSPHLYQGLRTMMDFSIFKNPIFLFFAISNFFTSIGYNVPYIYIADMAIGDSKNPTNDKVSAGFLLSIIGISNTLSRVILGYLSDKPWVNRLYLYNSALTICGIATGLVSHTTNLNWLRIYSATFGATVGVYVSLTSVILVDLLGLDKLTNAFGLLLLFQGVATIIGPPIVGKLFDEFQDYRYGFWLAGGMIALSGLMLFFIPFLQRRRAKKELALLESEHSTRTNSQGKQNMISNSNGLSITNDKSKLAVV